MPPPFFWFALLFSFVAANAILGSAYAAPLTLAPLQGVAVSGTGYVTAGAAAFNGAAFNSGFTTQVAGKAVTVPATMRLAANAASFAATAVKTNPYIFVGTAVAGWLLPYAIEKCANGTWCVKQAGSASYNTVGNWCRIGDWQLQCMQGWTFQGDPWSQITSQYPSAVFHSQDVRTQYGAPEVRINYHRTPGGIFDYRHYRALSISQTERSVTTAEWDAVAAGPLSDAAASEISASAPLPLTVDPVAPLVVTLSDPYTDPVTGKRFKDVAYITPGTDPRFADLQVVKQEIDANGDPALDPETSTPKNPEQSDDECASHPNRVGCMDWGDTPDTGDPGELEKTISITPVSGFGAETAACPADMVYVTQNGGQTITQSFQPVCDAADMFRPVILAMAWFGAVLLAMGIHKRSGD